MKGPSMLIAIAHSSRIERFHERDYLCYSFWNATTGTGYIHCVFESGIEDDQFKWLVTRYSAVDRVHSFGHNLRALKCWLVPFCFSMVTSPARM
jgi:hypothetical protein